MILSFNEFKSELDQIVFEDSFKSLLEKIADYPERYTGLFDTVLKKCVFIDLLQGFVYLAFADTFPVSE